MGGSLRIGHAGGTTAGRNTASSEGRIKLTTTHFDPALRRLALRWFVLRWFVLRWFVLRWLALRWLGAVRHLPAQSRRPHVPVPRLRRNCPGTARRPGRAAPTTVSTVHPNASPPATSQGRCAPT